MKYSIVYKTNICLHIDMIDTNDFQLFLQLLTVRTQVPDTFRGLPRRKPRPLKINIGFYH